MLKFYQFPGACGVSSLSPPCMKLETWLRLTQIPYEHAGFDPSKAPKGKAPFVEDDGKLIGDSTLIIDYCKARYGKDPDAHLTSSQRAVSLAFRRMLKENFYWVIIQSRWKMDENWAIYREMLTSMIPVPPETPMDARLAFLDQQLRPMILEQMHAQGMGRHSADEVFQLGIGDLSAVSDYLADKPYFMGEQPSTADAVVYASLAGVLDVPMPSPVRDFARSRQNLVAYCRRMRERYFPEITWAE